MLRGNFEENKKKFKKTHCRYLTDRQKNIVEQVYDMPIKEYSYKTPNGQITIETRGVITHDEFDKLIRENIDFPLLDKTILYNRE